MRYVVVGVLTLGIVALAVAGNGTSLWNIDDARLVAETPGKGIEMKVAINGAYEEIEYHYPLSEIGKVPPQVRDKMDQMFPGPVTGIEKEYHASGTYWELTKLVNQKKHEVMFDTAGKPVSFEIAIDVGEVPPPVKNGLEAAYPQAANTAVEWEKIIDGEDLATPPSAYHAKFKVGSRALKVVVQPNGHVPAAYLEVPAEIEVPVPVGQIK